MFVGFSPELELAIYTLAVLVKPDEALDINLGGKIFQIKTYMLQNDSKKYLAGAYVDFWKISFNEFFKCISMLCKVYTNR